MSGAELIVARIAPGDGPERVAELFGASDATDLPKVLGVRSRSLYRYQDLYFHLVQFDGDPREALELARSRPDFHELSRELSAYVTPYDPRTWRSPADALASEFYRWDRDGR